MKMIDQVSLYLLAGMCEVGRIKHHLKHNIWNPKSTILFVGYQAPGTLGYSIVNGAKKVKIFGEEFAVNARIEYIEGYSGHADQEGLMNFIYSFVNKPKHIFLVHGEPESQDIFKQKVEDETNIPVTIPEFGETYDISDEIKMTHKIERKIPLEDINYIIIEDNKTVITTRLLSEISKDRNKLMAKKLSKLINEINPDLIISTHPFSSQMASYLKGKGKIDCEIATILTDFAIHKQWLVGSEYTNNFFVSNDNMKNDMIELGINENKIHVSLITGSIHDLFHDSSNRYSCFCI